MAELDRCLAAARSLRISEFDWLTGIFHTPSTSMLNRLYRWFTGRDTWPASTGEVPSRLPQGHECLPDQSSSASEAVALVRTGSPSETAAAAIGANQPDDVEPRNENLLTKSVGRLHTLAQYWDLIGDLSPKERLLAATASECAGDNADACELRALSRRAANPTVALLCHFVAMRLEGTLSDREIFVAWRMSRKDDGPDVTAMADWCRQRLGADPSVVAAHICIDDVNWRVIGELVMENHMESLHARGVV